MYLCNLPNSWVFGESPKFLHIWCISQIPRYLRNLPNIQVSGESPKFQDILGISQTSRYPGNLPNSKISWESPKYRGIWGIYQIPRCLGNLPNSQVSGESPKFLESRAQMPGYLRSFLNIKKKPTSTYKRYFENCELLLHYDQMHKYAYLQGWVLFLGNYHIYFIIQFQSF